MTLKTYEEALQWVEEQAPFGIKPGLSRVEHLLAKLGSPERRLKSVHIAGTNGKGSTAEFMRASLTEAGIVTGTFTSPYIVDFRERIAVDKDPISKQAFLEIANQLKPLADELQESSLGHPTSFELVTVIAIKYFASYAFPDIVIWETGLGGRLDCTNVVSPMISLITNVGSDHAAILGEEKIDRAYEKAGIIKSGVPVATAEEDPEVLTLIRETAKNNRTKTYELGQDFHIEAEAGNERFSYYSIYPFGTKKDLTLGLKGGYQQKNAALAMAALDYLKMMYALPIEEEHIRIGLTRAQWPARLEVVQEHPLIILDGAHNKEGVDALASYISQQYKDKQIHLILCCTSEKDPEQVFASLMDFPLSSLKFTTFEGYRAPSSEEVKGKAMTIGAQPVEDVFEAINATKAQAEPADLILITGSLYFISTVRTTFM
ncbi:bifunctional folylpolyglutamate synthase/dihydrofolate synthase [Salsuginibacillus kocurii]|uniref:bifunctional folylpolyglutamate synthase/dihydrofolate synthase n=1 Tax=Salsuginibacillus kocurii TaxID=427078 RepID=UPI000366F068|nr:folylpolyglutamate synthase/dihydrofolate synthase family protein [Salsuginibacillus kocurii]